MALATATAARGATIAVTGTLDSIAVDGLVTLREAITAANTNAPSGDAPAGTGNVNNHFNIAGAPGTVHGILPISPLPTISEAVVIDGYTQLGSSQNTSATGTNAFLAIELQGTLAGFASGLVIDGSPGPTVRGLVINRFFAEGINVFGDGGNVIAGKLHRHGPDGQAGPGEGRRRCPGQLGRQRRGRHDPRRPEPHLGEPQRGGDLLLHLFPWLPRPARARRAPRRARKPASQPQSR